MKLDKKGNIIIGTTALLIASLLIMCIFITTSITQLQNENTEIEANDNFKYIIDDYATNIEIEGRSAISETSEIVFKGWPVFNSREEIKNKLNDRLNDINKDYSEKYDIELTSNVLSVENTDSPWKMLFKVRLSGEKNPERFSQIIMRNVSIEGLKDPLPLAKLTALSSVGIIGDWYHYGKSLSAYMLVHNLKSPGSYLFATSPLIVKKCPYDPYIHHGDPGVLKDCLKQGYYHESADGSCYLCRIEGKGKCPHYGMEVFIQPHTPLINDSLSCSDHVIFNDHYNGEKLDKFDINSLILDSSHQKKYGLDKI